MKTPSISYKTAQVNRLKVFYREAGDPQTSAVLLLHGFPTSSHMFRNLIPQLAGDYYVVAPDLPGFGFSDAPAHESFRYTFDQEFFRTHRPPTLAVWEKNDPFFLPAGAEAFRRDNPSAKVVFYDTGHFALETHAAEIAAEIRDFLNTIRRG
jgi:pimeloyl-ACP methyl ester carboxylesterase